MHLPIQTLLAGLIAFLTPMAVVVAETNGMEVTTETVDLDPGLNAGPRSDGWGLDLRVNG